MPSVDSFEMTPQEIQQLQNSGEKLHLIDVREPAEWALTRIEGSVLVPMGSVPASFQSLEDQAEEAPLIVYCHHGVRSLQVVAWLRERGLSCYSMAGGIDRWSSEVDPTVARY